MKAISFLLGGTAVIAASVGVSPLDPIAAAPAATATCTAVPAGATFIATSASGATVDRAGSSEVLTLPITGPVQTVMRGPDGTVWVQAVVEGTQGVYRVGSDGSSTLVASGEVELKSVGWLDGRSAAALVDYSEDYVRPGDADGSGAVWVEYADGTHVDAEPAQGPEYGVLYVNIGAGRLVRGGWSDLTEWIGFSDASGQELADWFVPTEIAPYNSPPFFQAPFAASDTDGATLTWVEGPELDGATDEMVGGWTLVVADAVSGTESLRLDLGDPGSGLIRADFDGRFWVGAFDTTTATSQSDSPVTAEHVLVVDTDAATPAATDAGCPADVTVTLDRMGTPEPEAPAPTTTTTVPPAPTPTTAAPNTTAPATCPSYAENPNTYPVKLCQTGSAVRNVQVELVQNGYDVEIDGYFGPNTQAAVRAFQSDHGLEVDGLVGPDTWARLIGDDFLGTDADGNDTVDPWEIVYDDANESDQWEQYIGLVYNSSPPDFGIIDQSTGTAVPGLSARAGMIVNCCDIPAWLVEHIVWAGGDMLWLSRSEGHNPDGTPLPWTVHDAVGFTLADGEELSTLCDLDGTYSPAVVGVVGVPHSAGGPFTNITTAWIVDTANGKITPVDPARVACSFEGD